MRLVRDAAGIVALVVLDALATSVRWATSACQMAGVLRPGAVIRGGAIVLASAPGDSAAAVVDVPVMLDALMMLCISPNCSDLRLKAPRPAFSAFFDQN